MAVESTAVSTGPLPANGVTTAFDFTFKALSESEVAVVAYDGDGVEAALPAFSVALADGGGTVTFETPPADGLSVYLLSDPEFRQQIEFEQGSKWLASPVNEANDRSALRDLWLRAKLALINSATLFLPSARAGRFLAWDANGDPVAASGSGADGALRTDLAASSGSSLSGFLQAGTGAVSRTARDKLRETVSITDFGAIGDGLTNNDAAFASARAYIVTTRSRLRFPPGVYVVTESPNWAVQDAVIYADGDVTIRGMGTGHAVLIDGSAMDAVAGPNGCNNVTMTGFKVENAVDAEEPILARTCHHSWLNFRVLGGNPTKYGMLIEFCVLTVFDQPTVSGNPTGAWYLDSAPLGGIKVDHYASQPAAYCTFVNPICEGPAFGMLLDHTLGNVIEAGALEGCTDTGLHLTSHAFLNKIRGTDFEVNTNYDIYCEGENNIFDGVDTEKIIVIHGGQNNQILGGTHAGIQIDSGSMANSIEGVRYARPKPDGTPSGGVITDNGTRTRRRDNLNMVTQKFANVGLTEAAQTVGASPFSYVNNSANAVSLLVTGGTVSAIEFAPQNVVGRATGQTSGMFRLRAGDGLVVTFSAAPTVYLYQE